MPWTFAHPAAVLPFRRIGGIEFPLSGLVAGSLVPDLGYYFGPNGMATFAHTMGGLLLFCLPVALLVVFLLVFLRDLLVAPLPQPHRAAIGSLPSPDLFSAAGILLMVISILIGATTHIAWDSFTHNSGLAVRWFALLQQEIGKVTARTFYVYNVLQHASTLLGSALLVVAYRNWIRQVSPVQPQCITVGVGAYFPLVACVLVSFAAGLVFSLLRLSDRAPFAVITVRTVLAGTVFFVVAYIGLAVYMKQKNPPGQS